MTTRRSADPHEHVDEAGEFLRERLLTVPEAAEILAVAPATVYEWIRAGRLPHIRLGPRAIRFTRGLLAAWIAACHVPER
jgi:excisionase family DNA binding protein